MKADFHRKIAFIALIALLLSLFATLCLADELTMRAYRGSENKQEKPGYWVLNLQFSHSVFADDLKNALKVTVDGADEQYVLHNARGYSKVPQAREFRLQTVLPSKPGASVKVVVAGRLPDASGRYLMANEFSYQFLYGELITVKSFSTFFRSRTDKGLKLLLSSAVDQNELTAAMKIQPSVENMTVTRVGQSRFRITGDFQYDKRYSLQISEVAVDAGRASLEERQLDFTGPGIKPELQIQTAQSVVELKGRQLLPLTLADVSKVGCELIRIPPYLAPEIPSKDELRRILWHSKTDPKLPSVPASGSRPAAPAHDGSVPPPLPPMEGSWQAAGPPVPREDRKEALKSLAETGRVFSGFLGEFTLASEVFFAPEAQDHTLGYSLPLSFRATPEKGGIWLASLSDPDRNLEGKPSRVIQITDLSISYKCSAHNLLLWVTSIHSGKPVSDVELMLGRSDGIRTFVGKTDKDGVVFLRDGDKFPSVRVNDESWGISNQPLTVSRVRWVVAATHTDACAVSLDADRLSPKGVTQTSEIQDLPNSQTGYLFTERGVYKPGETVHFKFFAREYQDNQIISTAGKKPRLEIKGPRGDVVYTKELTLSEFGTCHDSLKLEKFFPVGTYNLEATLPRKETDHRSREVFTRTFLVQEYKRPKHFVSLTMKRTEHTSKEYIGLERREDFLSVEVAGQYYTGGPVKHTKARWKATLVPTTNKVPGLEDYFFGNEDTKTLFLESGESTLDASGKLHISIPLDARLLTGIYGVSVSATVLDIDGEPATEVATFKPQLRFLVGVSQQEGQDDTGAASPIKVVVSNAKGQLVQQGKIEACIMEKKSLYTCKRDEAGNLNSMEEEVWSKTRTLQQRLVKGEAFFNDGLMSSGEYLVVFTYEDTTGRYSSQKLFRRNVDEDDSWRSRRTERYTGPNNQITVTTRKTAYVPGDTIGIDFRIPRPIKKCLVAIERTGVLDFKLIDVNGTEGKSEFKVTENYLPNVYVSVIAPAGREGFPVYASQADTDIPTMYYGYAQVAVRSQLRKLRCEIDSGRTELKGRPGDSKKLSLRVTDQKGKGVVSELAVCVVDEALLALTRFATPELSSLTNFSLPLAVFSGDLRLALVSQDLSRMFSTKPLTGGDGVAGPGQTAATLKLRNDFRPLAYFNPALVTDASGRAEVEFKLPDTTTAYRVYVVACDKGPGFTSNQRKMVVSKEFFVEPALPRFLIPGDRLTFALNLQNKTAEKGQASVSAESSKNVKMQLLQDGADIAPWSSATVKANAEVKTGKQEAKLIFKGRLVVPSARYGDAIEQTLPIRSRYLVVHRSIVGSFTQQTDIPVDLPKILMTLNPDEVNPADLQAHLICSTTDWTKITPGLKYLWRYPYGCVEQTSSGIIPLAGLRGLIASGAIPDVTVTEIDGFIEKGVERLLSMQLPNGGFSYWPGQTTVSWGTVYATFALTAAKQAGYPVPEARLNAALDYLRGDLFKYRKGDRPHSDAWTKEFAIWNLALNDRLTAAELEPFIKHYDSASIQYKALLLIAAAKVGYVPEKKIVEMLSDLDPKPDPRQVNYRNSSFRQIAACLLAAVETGSELEKADTWAGYLLNGLKPDGRWASTADTGWCLLALSKYYERRGSGKAESFKLGIDYGADKPEEVTVSDGTVSRPLDPKKLLATGKIRVTADSRHLVNYTLSLTYPDLDTEPSSLSRGLTLLKRMENLNGKEEIRVGDIVRVTLNIGILQWPDRDRWSRYEYFALEDPVPAGLVPINSELATEGVRNDSSDDRYDRWRDGYYDFTPTRVEFRDDGVRVFKDYAWRGQYQYSYLARAVAAGEFWMRGSRISLMYDPEHFGKTLGQKVKVLPAGK